MPSAYPDRHRADAERFFQVAKHFRASFPVALHMPGHRCSSQQDGIPSVPGYCNPAPSSELPAGSHVSPGIYDPRPRYAIR